MTYVSPAEDEVLEVSALPETAQLRIEHRGDASSWKSSVYICMKAHSFKKPAEARVIAAVAPAVTEVPCAVTDSVLGLSC